MKKKNIKSIQLCYGKRHDGRLLHLIRMRSGSGILKTTSEMRRLGLIKMKSPTRHRANASEVAAMRRAWN